MVDLWQELADHHRELSPLFEPAEDSREKWSKYLAKKFSEKSTKLFVAAEDHHLVGFMLCMLSPNAPIFKERTIGLISDVYVRPERRNKGITREMLRAALKWFHKNKCKTVSLTVAAANFEARAVWGQLGLQAAHDTQAAGHQRIPRERAPDRPVQAPEAEGREEEGEKQG